MWVMTNIGVFSAVERKPGSYKPGGLDLQVRARVRGHLVALRKQYLPTAGKILELDGHDYQYRIYCRKSEWAAAVAAMAEDIDYTNFKSSVKDNVLHNALMKVWNAVLTSFPSGSIYDYRRGGRQTRRSGGGFPWDRHESLSRRLGGGRGHQTFTEQDMRDMGF